MGPNNQPPDLSLFLVLRFSSAEQGFLLCSNQDTLDPSGCSHVDSTEILYYPMVIYIVWQILYILIVSIISYIVNLTLKLVDAVIALACNV